LINGYSDPLARLLRSIHACSDVVTLRRKRPPVTADSTPDQQTALRDPVAVSDRLRRQFAMLGIPFTLWPGSVGPHPVVRFSSLWLADAHRLAEALDKIPELRPYVSDRAPAATATKDV
jgi:hypothetical protein